MFDFCPQHGNRLEEAGDFTAYWCRVLQCPHPTCPGYIDVGDPQWIYPLLQLQTGVLPALRTASAATLEEAFRRIKRIDYKTVSIIFFEQTILGCYRRREEYKVVYPDGSDGHLSPPE